LGFLRILKDFCEFLNNFKISGFLDFWILRMLTEYIGILEYSDFLDFRGIFRNQWNIRFFFWGCGQKFLNLATPAALEILEFLRIFEDFEDF
jgi:hypothetical protein